MLSSRGLKNVNELGRPWRFTPTATYDPDTNPEGLISFGMAENVRALFKCFQKGGDSYSLTIF